MMERLPVELYLKIFCLLDHQNLASAQQVCRKWKVLASDNVLWSNLFKERWGEDRAAFYAPEESNSWKDVYEVQDRCDRVGLGPKIIREGMDYYLIYRGEIQRYLGSRRQRKSLNHSCTLDTQNELNREGTSLERGSSYGILNKILFFIGDLEVASIEAKRSRMV
ncbi:hypothetical protein Ancab_010008 [Ancistrocladus abbreviatus]